MGPHRTKGARNVGEPWGMLEFHIKFYLKILHWGTTWKCLYHQSSCPLSFMPPRALCFSLKRTKLPLTTESLYIPSLLAEMFNFLLPSVLTVRNKTIMPTVFSNFYSIVTSTWKPSWLLWLGQIAQLMIYRLWTFVHLLIHLFILGNTGKGSIMY